MRNRRRDEAPASKPPMKSLPPTARETRLPPGYPESVSPMKSLPPTARETQDNPCPLCGGSGECPS